jgi:hypothetical protein
MVVVGCALLCGAAGLAAGWGLRAVGAFGSGSSQPEEEQGPVAVQFIHNLRPVIADETPSLKVELPFVNRTRRVVRVKEVRHCCGVATAGVAVKELQPGEETVLTLGINISGRHGDQAFNASIQSDAGDEWSYRVRTVVYDCFKVEPYNGIRFGLVDPNERASSTAHVLFYARAGEPLPDLLKFQSSCEYIKVTPGDPVDEPQPDGIICRKFPVTARLTAPAASDVTNSSISVTSQKKEGGLEEIRVPVVWGVKRLYELAPARVFFRKADIADGALQKHVSVRRLDGRTFRILGVKAVHPAISASAAQSGQASEHRLSITLDSARFAETLWDEVVVTTDHPLQPVLRIPVAAFATKLK